MKVLVTGGAGFIGSHIVDNLINSGFKVVIVDNLSTGNMYINDKATFYNLDITDMNIEQVFTLENPDFLIHHAAQIDVQRSIIDPFYDAKVNILGTINLLKLAVKYNVKKFIYASSAAVYGNPDYLGVDEKHLVKPLSFYGISKHTPEHYLHAFSSLYGLNFTILRYSNVYGIRQDPKGEGGVISIFIDKLLNEESPCIFGDGEQTRDFIYVKDIASANLAALYKGDGEIINISINKQASINELLLLMNDICGNDIKPIYKEARKGDILHSYLENTKAIEILNWEPKYSITEGLKETIEYYRKEYCKNIMNV